ncbi:kinesin motor protein cin8 [Orbilia oligospora]|nr:kinesin motor protein cin8 [Orbilia oligospora]KAF3239481.1 kinesin motor protein cin8 [Orbilia oligospora]KAF3243943.1 kinesin motor protein cin8 [Orbilia oligospora]
MSSRYGARGPNRKPTAPAKGSNNNAQNRPSSRAAGNASSSSSSRPAYMNPAVQATARPGSPTESIATTRTKNPDTRHRSPDETNVQVVVRCRGRNEREIQENSAVILSTPGGPRGNEVLVSMGPMSLSNKTYMFDRVFGPEADQSMIYDDVVAPILEEVLAGYNCTIFAYGQTGTGKTYTMTGDMKPYFDTYSDGAGIIPRALHNLFKLLDGESEPMVKCSFIELYNEELRDLLSADETIKLKMFEDSSKKGGVVINGMEERFAHNAEDGVNLLQEGSRKRQVAATKCNDLSSRSHTVFTIIVQVKDKNAAGEDFMRTGKLNLVDLAGSESVGRSGAENKRAKEAGMINQSLLSLGRVITALVEKNSYIPYRESKLTRLLQDSLGGRTKTCIIATVSPAKVNLEETISTLNYAATAKNIENKPQLNQLMTKRAVIKEYITEIERLRADLNATRQKHGVYMSEEHFQQLNRENDTRKTLVEEHERKIAVLEQQLRTARENLEKNLKSFMDLKKDYDGQTVSLEETREALFSTETSLVLATQELSDEQLITKAYKLTEAELSTKASNLASVASAAIRDVDGLHAKVGRQEELQGLNKATWDSVKQQTFDVTGLVEGEIKKFIKEQARLQDGVAARMDSFIQLQGDKLSKAYSSLDEGLEKLEVARSSATGTAREAADEMNLVLEEIKVLRDDVKVKVGEGMRSMSSAAEKIAGDVVRELEGFKEEMRSSYIGLGRDFKAMFDACSKHLAAQTQKANDLRLEVEAANKAAITAQASAADSIAAVLAEESQKAAHERQQLVAQITQLVTKNALEQDKRLAQRMGSVQSGLTVTSDRLSSATGSICAGINQWSEAEEGFRGGLSVTRDGIKKKLQTDALANESRASGIQQTANSIHAETIQLVNSQMQSVAVNMQTLDEFVTRAREHNERHHRLKVSSLDSVADQVKSSTSAVRYNIDDVKQEVEDIGADVLAATVKAKNALDPFNIYSASLLSGLRGQTELSVYRDYVPTNSSPKKRSYPFDDDLPKTATREQILNAAPDRNPMREVIPEAQTFNAATSEMTATRNGDRVPLADLAVDSNVALLSLAITGDKKKKAAKTMVKRDTPEHEDEDDDIEDVSMIQMSVKKGKKKSEPNGPNTVERSVRKLRKKKQENEEEETVEVSPTKKTNIKGAVGSESPKKKSKVVSEPPALEGVMSPPPAKRAKTSKIGLISQQSGRRRASFSGPPPSLRQGSLIPSAPGSARKPRNGRPQST